MGSHQVVNRSLKLDKRDNYVLERIYAFVSLPKYMSMVCSIIVL